MCILVTFSIFCFRYQLEMLNFSDWVDEDETVAAVKMMYTGKLLYSEVFNQHGPLVFLSGLVLEYFGNSEVSQNRIPIMILQIIALISIYTSPVIKQHRIRIYYFVTCAMLMVVFSPLFYGNTYTYQVMAGLFISIIISQHTLPIIIEPENVSPWRENTGNLMIGCLPFFAITYAPIATILFILAIKKCNYGRNLSYFTIAILGNILFLYSIGSLKGYYAYHIYLNSTIIPIYNGQSGLQFFRTAFETVSENYGQFCLFLIVTYSISVLLSKEQGFPWRSLLLGAGIASLLIRGAGNQAPPYFYAALTIPLAVGHGRVITSGPGRWMAILFLGVCLTKISLLLPGDMNRISTRRLPIITEFSQIARMVTKEDDKIVSFTFRNIEYILSNRQPVSGFFFYLPWQADYNANPKFGFFTNVCEEITTYRPKIMLINQESVSPANPWQKYGKCVQDFADSDYVKLEDRPIYIRSDLADSIADAQRLISSFKPSSGYAMQASAQLGEMAPIKVALHRGDASAGKQVVGMYIRFGTHMRRNEGTAILRLPLNDGSSHAVTFSLPELADNQYQYFAVPPGNYLSAEIGFVSGGGVSTWESHQNDGRVHTCVILDYADGSRGLTPGCPLG